MIDFKKLLKPLKLRPSDAFRWTVCTASPRYIANNEHRLPPRDTVWNLEGTKAHGVASSVLLRSKTHVSCPEDAMERHAVAYANFCRDNSAGGYEFIEQKIPLWYRDGNGVVDYLRFGEGSLFVTDYKYGKGVAVGAFENLQMMIYARSAVEHFSLEAAGLIDDGSTVDMAIYQPRVRDGATKSRWEIKWSELKTRTKYIVEDAVRIIEDGSNVKFSPSKETCKFCPAATFCDARIDWLTGPVEALRDEFDALPKASDVSELKIAEILAQKTQLEKWLKDLQTYALQMILKGETIPGLKIVAGKGSREWRDEALAEQALTAAGLVNVVTRSTMSPHAAEEALKDAGIDIDLSPFILKHEGAPTIAQASDKRSSLDDDLVSQFPIIEDTVKDCRDYFSNTANKIK